MQPQTHSTESPPRPEDGRPDARKFYTMCVGKKQYSKREAQTAINSIMRGHRKDRPDNLRHYHCPFCNHWHLTKKI